MLFGLAGLVPYAATSAAVVTLAYDLNTSFIIDPKTAEMLLNVIEPIQIGYGAVVWPTINWYDLADSVDHLVPRSHPYRR